MEVNVRRTDFVKNGYYVEVFQLINDHGFEVTLTNYGCTLMNFYWPGLTGKSQDILLGFDTIENWFGDQSFFGSTAGRCCNRIRDSKFNIGDKEFKLSANVPPHHLHGGFSGFDQKMWRAIPYSLHQEVGVRMYYLSRHLEEGYPGNLSVEANLKLDNENQLTIEYRASSDMTTICNITSHPYFNLDDSETVLSHKLWIDADQISKIDSSLLTTGDLLPVIDTPFNFTEGIKLGKQLTKVHPQLVLTDGIDHNYVLNPHHLTMPVASLESEHSGRKIIFFTNQPGIQLYTGNHLSSMGKNKCIYKKYAGICLETQGFPNAANIKSFPSVLLKQGEQYHSITKIKCENG